jgi:hypothetical protein
MDIDDRQREEERDEEEMGTANGMKQNNEPQTTNIVHFLDPAIVADTRELLLRSEAEVTDTLPLHRTSVVTNSLVVGIGNRAAVLARSSSEFEALQEPVNAIDSSCPSRRPRKRRNRCSSERIYRGD